MPDSLYLIEILVQEVIYDNIEIDKLSICVDVKLGQIADFSIELNEKPDIFNIALVNPGKSFLFPASPYVLKHQLPHTKIQFIVKQTINNNNNNNNNNENEKIKVYEVLGETEMDWPISFCKLAERSEKLKDLLPECTNEKLLFNESYNHTGSIKLFIRFSCFGHDIQTSYQVVQTKDEAMSYLFKGSKIPTPFKTAEYGHGGKKDLLPLGPLFSNKDRGKKPSNYSLNLTDSEIETSLCNDKECLAAYKFKEYDIGPLSKKEKEIISPCGGLTCQYAYEVDDPPCVGYRKCKFNTPQRPVNKEPNPCIHKESIGENDFISKSEQSSVPFKPYILTPRKNYSSFSSAVDVTKQCSTNTGAKFSQILTNSQGDDSQNTGSKHVCQGRCTVPKPTTCCSNDGHLRAGGENCCSDQKSQTPEKPACQKTTCKHLKKPPCKPLPCCNKPPCSKPPCGLPPCNPPPCNPPPCNPPPCNPPPCNPPPCSPPSCGTCGKSCCNPPSPGCFQQIPVETLCLCPTICEDCGGYSRSGKTCKDLKKQGGFDNLPNFSDYVRIDNVKCFCNHGPEIECNQECNSIENNVNQMSTQTASPNLNSEKVHASTSIESIISRNSNNTIISSCHSKKTIKSNVSQKSNKSGKMIIKNDLLNYEVKPPFERLKSGGGKSDSRIIAKIQRLKSGGVSPVSGKVLDQHGDIGRESSAVNGSGDQFVSERPKKRKPTLVYDIGNSYPGNRIGHKSCLLKIPTCPAKKGWEWSPEPSLFPLKPRKEYKPGFIPKEIQDTINDAREQHGLQVISVRAPKKKKKKGKASSTAAGMASSVVADDEDEGDEYEVEEKNTLTFQRKDGTYFIKMNPLRDPKTVQDNEDPYINCPPIEFTYTKDPFKKTMLGEDQCDCCICENEENAMENDELNVDFSPPMGIVEMERMKKAPNVVHFWTQYEELDFGTPPSQKGKPKK